MSPKSFFESKKYLDIGYAQGVQGVVSGGYTVRREQDSNKEMGFFQAFSVNV